MKWFELAKVGQYTDRFGQLVNLTREKLQAVASQYKPDFYQAPITVGHPESQKEPAWGRVAAVRFDEGTDTLMFRPARLVAEFAEMVNRGMYTHVSPAFDTGSWSLIHVAFLGAKPPAIKGMKEILNVELAAAPDQLVSVDTSDIVREWLGKAEFSERDHWVGWQIKTLGRIMRRLRDKFVETDGVEKANSLIYEYELEELTKDPPSGIAETTTQFSSSTEVDMTLEQQVADLTKNVTELSAKVTAVEAENVELKVKLTAAEAECVSLKSAATKREYAEFCDGLISEGRLLADQKEKTIAVMESLDNSKTVEFSEGEKVSSLELYKQQLKAAPKRVEFSEFMTNDRIGQGSAEANPYVELGRSIAETVNPKK